MTTATFPSIWLPTYPLAADSYDHGVYRLERDTALTKRHIQVNPSSLANLIVLDVDRPTAVEDVLWDNDTLRPHYVAQNPTNGHAHVAWAIEEPVTISPEGRAAPKALLERDAEGLRTMFGGDRGYSGLLFKNPLHKNWKHYHSPGLDPYTLGDIAGALDDAGFFPPPKWKREQQKAGELAGIGRNCTLFDEARVRAYKVVKDYRNLPNGVELYGQYVEHIVKTLNVGLGFAQPLHDREVRGIAASIVRWVVNRSGMWDGDSPAYVAKRKAISAAGNAAKSGKKAERIRAARAAYVRSGMKLTNREIAETVGMSVKWVEVNRAAIKDGSTSC